MPLFNIHPIIKATLIPVIAIHFLMTLLPYRMQNDIIYYAALIPAQYIYDTKPHIWTLITYAFLHGGWMHLILNAVWFVIFTSPLTRIMPVRHILNLLIIANIAGAAAHLATHWGSTSPVIGASAAVSGAMAAAMYLIFGHRNSPIQPAVFFLIWIGLNLLSAIPGSSPFGGNIAWQAHIGGFIAGLAYAQWWKNRYRTP